MDPFNVAPLPSVTEQGMSGILADLSEQMGVGNQFFDLPDMDPDPQHAILDVLPDMVSFPNSHNLHCVLEDSGYLADEASLTPMVADPSFDTRPSTQSRDSPPGTSSGNLRKRKATTLRAQDWEPYKQRIIELYKNESKTLPEVKTMIREEFGFDAE